MINPIKKKEVGFVTTSRGLLFSLEGLPSVKVNSLIQNEKGNRAIVTSLKDDVAVATMLDNDSVVPGDRFAVSDNINLFSVNEKLFGRVISPSGEARDLNEEEIDKNGEELNIDEVVKGINERIKIKEQCITGTLICDVLIPLAKGQRQLVYGPPKSGKRAFVKQVLSSQHREGTVCLYVICGRSPAEIRKISEDIHKKQKAKNAIIIAASSDDPSSLIAITPTIGFSVAEVFINQGRDVLMVLDDLGTHAKYLRELALLQKQLPGRESYPGDLFYQHAKLMERSGAFKNGAKLTLLPILENDSESTRDLVSTNIIAATDGNYAFSVSKNFSGIFPAIEMDDSITRVGRNTQGELQKKISTELNLLLGWYREQVIYSDFASISLLKTKEKVKKGEILHEFLQQDIKKNVELTTQLILLSLVLTNFTDGVEIEMVKYCKEGLIDTIDKDKSFTKLHKLAKTTEDLEVFLNEVEKVTPVLIDICLQK